MPAAEPMFHVDQRVVVINESDGWARVQPGDRGVVVSVDWVDHTQMYKYRVDFDAYKDWRGYEYCFEPFIEDGAITYPGMEVPEGYLFTKGESVFHKKWNRTTTITGSDPLLAYSSFREASTPVVPADLTLLGPAPDYPPYTEPQTGDKVMIVSSRYSWGVGRPLMVGTVVQVNHNYEEIMVSFKGARGTWLGGFNDFLLVERRTAPEDREIKHKEVSGMSTEELEKSINVIKRKVQDLHDLPLGSVKTVIRTGLRLKTSLNALLGHSHVNNFRTIIDLPTNESNWEEDITNLHIKRMIAYHMGWSFEAMTCHKNEYVDSRKNVRRITKLVLAELQRWDSHPLRDFFYRLGWEEKAFGQKLGEAMAARASKDVLVISTNLFDFITASGDYWGLAAFGSCHGFDGCHFNGNLAYWNDDFTLIAYVAPRNRLDYKIGRSWVYLPEPRTIIVEAKSYGTFPAHMRRQMREHLEHKLDKFSDFSGTWRKRNVTYPDISGAGVNYFDHGNVDIAYTTHAYPDGITSGHYPALEFSDAICLECGDYTEYQENGVCEDCNDMTKCCDCGCRLHSGETHTSQNGYDYCENCYYERYTSCEHCGCELPIDSVYQADGYDYCKYCYDRKFVCCERCGEAIPKDEIIATSDGCCYCEDCAERKGYQQCGDCGEWSDECVEIKDKGGQLRCPDCVGIFTQCQECGEYFFDTYEHEGHAYCSDCYNDLDIEVELDEAA